MPRWGRCLSCAPCLRSSASPSPPGPSPASADEVREGEHARLRPQPSCCCSASPADLSDPWARPGSKRAVRDVTALGGTRAHLFITLAVAGYLAWRGKRGAALASCSSRSSGAMALSYLGQGPDRPTTARPGAACRRGLHQQLPQRPRHRCRRHLPDAGRPPGPVPSRAAGSRSISSRSPCIITVADRPLAPLSRRPLADRRAGRLDPGRRLGTHLLDHRALPAAAGAAGGRARATGLSLSRPPAAPSAPAAPRPPPP